MAEGRKHKILKQVALRWVQKTGCVVFACEVKFDWIGIVDVVGLKTNGDVYIIEAKASTSDMKSDFKDKRWREAKIKRIANSSKIDFIYYITADGVEIPDEFPDFIGLLDESGRVRRKAKRRVRVHNAVTTCADLSKMARACSWRAYGHVIRHEKEQLEFDLHSNNS